MVYNPFFWIALFLSLIPEAATQVDEHRSGYEGFNATELRDICKWPEHKIMEILRWRQANNEPISEEDLHLLMEADTPSSQHSDNENDSAAEDGEDKAMQQAILLSIEEDKKRKAALNEWPNNNESEDEFTDKQLTEMALDKSEMEFLDKQLTEMALDKSEVEFLDKQITELAKKESKKFNAQRQQPHEQHQQNPSTVVTPKKLSPAEEVVLDLMKQSVLDAFKPNVQDKMRPLAKEALRNLEQNSKQRVRAAYDKWEYGEEYQKHIDQYLRGNGAESSRAAQNCANASSSSSLSTTTKQVHSRTNEGRQSNKSQTYGNCSQSGANANANVSSQKTPNRDSREEYSGAAENRTRQSSSTKNQSKKIFPAPPAQYGEPQNENNETDDSSDGSYENFDPGANKYYGNIKNSKSVSRRRSYKKRTNDGTISSSNASSTKGLKMPSSSRAQSSRKPALAPSPTTSSVTESENDEHSCKTYEMGTMEMRLKDGNDLLSNKTLLPKPKFKYYVDKVLKQNRVVNQFGNTSSSSKDQQTSHNNRKKSINELVDEDSSESE